MEIISYAPVGYRGVVVAVEVDIRHGIPGTDIVGLAGSEVREARDRVRVAIRNCGYAYPQNRVLINLAPADVPKSGNAFDLSIAAAILAADGQLNLCIRGKTLVLGELHLDGKIGSVRGVISAVAEATDLGVHRCVVPAGNLAEARAVGTVDAIGIDHLSEIQNVFCHFVDGGQRPAQSPQPENILASGHEPGGVAAYDCDDAHTEGGGGDFFELRGQVVFKRALEIAVAGGHHLLVVGPPGAGKSMGIGLVPTVSPPLSRTEALEVTRIHSLAGELADGAGLVRHRPFRRPHHSASAEGLLGGGRWVQPGEVSMAHRGALFLDETLEFGRAALQGLREPLELGRIRISRAGRHYYYPAAFQLFLAANPCPCGNLSRPDRECLCSVLEVDRYWRRLGGPLLDRIDIRVWVNGVTVSSLMQTASSATMRERINTARVAQDVRRRCGGSQSNAHPTTAPHRTNCLMTDVARRDLRVVTSKLGLSSRASVSVARVARTIADLEGSEEIRAAHVLEAIFFRRRGEDQPLWWSE